MFEYYEALGLEPKLALDPDDLRNRFYQRSRENHPDLRGSGAEDRMAQLNDAFRTLRDPIARAEYFLKEKGLESLKVAPPELLEESFELNSTLEELRSGDQTVRPQLVRAQERWSKQRTDLDQMLADFAELHDSPDQAARPEILGAIRDLLGARRYISNFLRDVDKELNVHLSN